MTILHRSGTIGQEHLDQTIGERNGRKSARIEKKEQKKRGRNEIQAQEHSVYREIL